MGLVANAILKGGGYVTGIIPKLLSKKEIINKEVWMSGFNEMV